MTLRAAVLAAATLAAWAGPDDPAHAEGVVRLSHADGVSRWAFLERPTQAYARPSFRAHVLGRLRLVTQDGTSELLYAEARLVRHGRAWVRVRLPLRPTGAVGWVPERVLGAYQEVRTHLVIDRARLRATLLRGRRAMFSARIGVGAPATPTPAGRFYIRSRLSRFGRGSIYGPLAFGTSARSRVLTDWPGGGFIGIHGTDQPSLIPGRPSHGCIRMRNPDIRRLDRLLSVGTPVTIR